TIIEVMIVLVIAAVILLIVFLAVPALQRNSRNTQKKNIAADLAAAVSEFTSNNNGTAPTVGSSATAGTNAESIFKLINANGIIKTVEVKTCVSGYLSICTDFDTGADDVAYILLKAKCTNNVAIAGSDNKQFAVAYRIENATPVTCLASGL
ncbi:MAG: type II secretion system protein, partial [Candidatus Saccharimonadales bacterium]